MQQRSLVEDVISWSPAYLLLSIFGGLDLLPWQLQQKPLQRPQPQQGLGLVPSPQEVFTSLRQHLDETMVSREKSENRPQTKSMIGFIGYIVVSVLLCGSRLIGLA